MPPSTPAALAPPPPVPILTAVALRTDADAVTAQCGAGNHTVAAGECGSSIAFKTGHFVDTLWQADGNSTLRAGRDEARTLAPGDKLDVPPIAVRWDPRATGQQHVFKRKGVPEKFRLRLLLQGEPLDHEPYALSVDGADAVPGDTDADGTLEAWIAPDARKVRLVLAEETIDFTLGALGPANTHDGAAERLVHLGVLEDEKSGGDYRLALSYFQQRQGMAPTGALDPATQKKLEEAFAEDGAAGGAS